MPQGFGGRGPRPCAFFNTPNGCKKGDFCRFAHIPAADNAAPNGQGLGQGMAQGFGPGMGQGMDQGMGMGVAGPGVNFGMNMGMGHDAHDFGQYPGEGFNEYPGDGDDAFSPQARRRCGRLRLLRNRVATSPQRRQNTPAALSAQCAPDGLMACSEWLRMPDCLVAGLESARRRDLSF